MAHGAQNKLGCEDALKYEETYSNVAVSRMSVNEITTLSIKKTKTCRLNSINTNIQCKHNLQTCNCLN